MKRRGLLLTMTEPPAAMEEEFNAWYDSEHLPERLAIPGFRSARRWVADCAPGEGKYLATYELDSPQVLESAAYLAHVGDHFTPWTKRCLGKAVVFRRWACEQTEPGDADPEPASVAIAMLAAEDEAPTRLTHAPGILRARRFLAHSGAPRYVALCELSDAAAAGALKPARGCVFRLYRAYRAQE
jgi:hypothetical protein